MNSFITISHIRFNFFFKKKRESELMEASLSVRKIYMSNKILHENLRCPAYMHLKVLISINYRARVPIYDEK